MTFSALQQRLLEHVTQRLRNGEITERGFARQIGISQPHIHNVLKGRRILSPKLSDRIMAYLGMSVLELADLVEIKKTAEKIWLGSVSLELVPLAGGRIGPDDPLPDLSQVRRTVPLVGIDISAMQNPIAAILGIDAELRGVGLDAGTMILIDRNEDLRLDLRDGHWYLFFLGDRALIRRPAFLGSAWQAGGMQIPFAKHQRLEMVRGLAVWAGDDSRRSAPLRQEGRYLFQERPDTASR